MQEDSGPWKFPVTKREALNLKDLGARISLTEDMHGNLVNLFQSIGADNELPSKKADRIMWLNHFHMQVAVNNPLWPEDMSFGYVYGAFANALMYNRVELKGHNVHAFITAFKNWITQSGVEHKLREMWNRKNPDQAPEQLKEQNERDPDLQNPEGMLNMSPEVVLSQLRTYLMIYKEDLGRSLEAVAPMASYRRPLWKTFHHYREQGKYEGQDLSDIDRIIKTTQQTQKQ